MTMSTVETDPSSEYVTLFTIYYPEAGSVSAEPRPLRLGAGFRYVSAADPITVNGSVYSPEPSLEYTTSNPMTGNIEPVEFSIKSRKGITGLSRLEKPFPVGRHTVEIREIVPGRPETLRTLMFGVIVNANSKRTARDTVLRCKCYGTKKFIKEASELSALSTCSWKFGSSACGFDLLGNTVGAGSLTILPSPQSNVVTVTLDSSPSLIVDRWRRGYLFNKSTGAKVLVRKLVSADVTGPFPVLTLDLSKVIDPDWVNDVLLLVPGCDKQIGTCRIHLREEAFSAFGIGMPGYNPSFYSS